MKLLKVDTPDAARKKLIEHISEKRLKKEKISLEEALGRVLAEDIVSAENIPSFNRSTVDGYAVNSSDTGCASDGIPVFLNVVEEVQMGKASGSTIRTGSCAYVPTGGMLPPGADAVVMIEYTESFDENSIAIYRSAAVGSNVAMKGEDISAGETVMQKGRVLEPKDMGVLAALGKDEVEVFAKWTVSVISTGDEVAGIKDILHEGQVRDINSYGISSLAVKNGMQIESVQLIKDDEKLLKQIVEEKMHTSDMIVISGGSSKGKKDVTAKVIDEAAAPGVFTHGIAAKPGKPTILGYDTASETLLFGLPGHPAAAMIIFDVICLKAYKRLLGIKESFPIEAYMETNAAAAPGRTTYLSVKITETSEGYRAVPITGKSGMITTLSSADGYVVIGTDKEGLRANEKVKVHLF